MHCPVRLWAAAVSCTCLLRESWSCPDISRLLAPGHLIGQASAPAAPQLRCCLKRFWLQTRQSYRLYLCALERIVYKYRVRVRDDLGGALVSSTSNKKMMARRNARWMLHAEQGSGWASCLSFTAVTEPKLAIKMANTEPCQISSHAADASDAIPGHRHSRGKESSVRDRRQCRRPDLLRCRPST